MNKTFKNILLMGRTGVQGIAETLLALGDYLSTQPVKIWIDHNAAALLPSCPYTIAEPDHFPSEIDLIIVVGGDGSLLQAARFSVEHHLPILGINRGRLGFLTDIHPNHLESIGKVLSGYYYQEERFLLSVKLMVHDVIVYESLALNDVVLLPGNTVSMIEFETYVDGQFVSAQHADGLIIATPTGSTAYALSGGGPILHPKLNAMVMVPMFPHRLSSRPIVVDGESEIEITIKHSSPHLSADGLSKVEVPPGAKIKIKKIPQKLSLIHPEDYDYFTTLREKLGWERKGNS
jgi:NAD+ kinase